MTIFQIALEKVLGGTKTQTRRLVNLGDIAMMDAETQCIDHVLTGAGRKRWQVGKTYAIQPGRGKKAVGRFAVTAIRREDVRTISEADARLDGFSAPADFWLAWTSMHDELIHKTLKEVHPSHFMNFLLERQASLYDAWVIEFELVKKNGTA